MTTVTNAKRHVPPHCHKPDDAAMARTAACDNSSPTTKSHHHQQQRLTITPSKRRRLQASPPPQSTPASSPTPSCSSFVNNDISSDSQHCIYVHPNELHSLASQANHAVVYHPIINAETLLPYLQQLPDYALTTILKPYLHTLLQSQSTTVINQICTTAVEIRQWQESQPSLLATVFSYLTSEETIAVRAVCQQWKRGTELPTSWQTKEVRIYKPCAEVDRIPNFCYAVQQLSIFTMCDRAVKWLGETCHYLQSLEAEILTHSAMLALGPSPATKNLKKLTITAPGELLRETKRLTPNDVIRDESFSSLSHMQQLTSLNLDEIEWLTVGVLPVLACACPQLQQLAIRHANRRWQELVFQRSTSLGYPLQLQGLQALAKFTELDDLHIEADVIPLNQLLHAVSLAPKLRHFTCQVVKFGLPFDIASNGSNDERVSDFSLLQSAKHLRVLKWSSPLTPTLAATLGQVKQIRQLHLTCCVNKQNAEAIYHSLGQLTDLQELHIDDGHIPNVPSVWELQKLQNLRVLHTTVGTGWDRPADLALAVFTTIASLPCLQSVHLESACTEAPGASLLTECQELKSLTIDTLMYHKKAQRDAMVAKWRAADICVTIKSTTQEPDNPHELTHRYGDLLDNIHHLDGLHAQTQTNEQFDDENEDATEEMHGSDEEEVEADADEE